MHVQFAYAAIGQSSGGEASDGQAAVARAVRAFRTAPVEPSGGGRARLIGERIVQKHPMHSGAVPAPVMAPVQRSNKQESDGTATRRCRFCIRLIGPAAGSRLLAACVRRPTLTGFFYQYPQFRCDFRQPSALRRTPGANPVALAKEL